LLQIRQLELESELVLTSKASAAAQNRYIYYPDHLVRLPSKIIDISEIWNEPLTKGVFKGLALESLVPKRPNDLEDESVGSFLSRRFGSAIADNLASAGLHGIYAGDLYQLSVRCLMPSLWKMEGEYGSITSCLFETGQFGGRPESLEKEASGLLESHHLQERNKNLIDLMKNVSVYSFKGGIETLTRTLVAKLETMKNVRIERDTAVEDIRYNESEKKVVVKVRIPIVLIYPP
jgi:protoporphyrinogen/coproporphyrinogen III oxidase